MVKPILVTGGTGYIGGRLVPRLLEKGYTVRCLARDPARLLGRTWSDQVECRRGDVTDAESLTGAFDGGDAAYYLIHSMGDTAGFHERDLAAARNFSAAASRAGVKRVIYLGGLGNSSDVLSEHLRSRQQTGEALRSAGVPVTEFRAAIVVGSGSVSFEMIRNLTERLPVMICPSWVFSRVQPIAVRNVLDYLVLALTQPESADKIIEIGGKDIITYGEMMTQYAKVRGLRRFLIPVPILTPRLSSYWVHWTTPIPAEIARPLIDGLKNEVIVRDGLALQLFPDIDLFDYRTAVARALTRLDDGDPETWWSDAIGTSLRDVAPQPVCVLCTEGFVRAGILVCPLPDSSVHLFRHDRQACRYRGEKGSNVMKTGILRSCVSSFLSHSPSHYRELGRIVSRAGSDDFESLFDTIRRPISTPTRENSCFGITCKSAVPLCTVYTFVNKDFSNSLEVTCIFHLQFCKLSAPVLRAIHKSVRKCLRDW